MPFRQNPGKGYKEDAALYCLSMHEHLVWPRGLEKRKEERKNGRKKERREGGRQGRKEEGKT